MKNLTLLAVLLLFIAVFHQKIQAQPILQQLLYFGHDRYSLTPEAVSRLDSICQELSGKNLLELSVIGHTDKDGSDSYNVELSKKRAAEVVAYFISRGINQYKILVDYCGETHPVTGNADDREKQQNRRVEVRAVLKEIRQDNSFPGLGPSSQIFNASADREINIQGMQGTRIVIPENSLETKNGIAVTGEVQVELKEYYRKSDFVVSGLHTMSGDQLLETGGMFYIAAIQQGEELQLKQGKAMRIYIPHSSPMEGMQTFTGKMQEGEIDWEATNILIEASDTSTYDDSRMRTYRVYGGKSLNLRRGLPGLLGRLIAFLSGTGKQQEMDAYTDAGNPENVISLDNYILSSTRLGWINCDRFYKYDDKTNLFVTYDTLYKPVIRLVFSNINSVMSGYHTKNKRVKFIEIPVGYKATLVAFSMLNDEPYAVFKDIEIGKNATENLVLAKTTLVDFEAKLKKLD